jgi:hypothetical protein
LITDCSAAANGAALKILSVQDLKDIGARTTKFNSDLFARIQAERVMGQRNTSILPPLSYLAIFENKKFSI